MVGLKTNISKPSICDCPHHGLYLMMKLVGMEHGTASNFKVDKWKQSFFLKYYNNWTVSNQTKEIIPLANYAHCIRHAKSAHILREPFKNYLADFFR